MRTSALLLAAAAAFALVPAASPCLAADKAKPAKVVILAQRGGDEHAWGRQVRQVRYSVEQSPDANGLLKAEAHLTGWPADPNTFNDADTVVLLSQGCGQHPLFQTRQRAATFDKVMKRGVGFVAIHYCLAALPGADDRKLLEWTGGVYKENLTQLKGVGLGELFASDANHPVSRGMKRSRFSDQYYGPMFHGEGAAAAKVTPIALVGPPDKPGETYAWAYERPGGGRTVAITGSDEAGVYDVDAMRTLLLNAVFWTAKLEVPAEGAKCRTPPPLGRAN
jgi:hypothetical protein